MCRCLRRLAVVGVVLAAVPSRPELSLETALVLRVVRIGAHPGAGGRTAAPRLGHARPVASLHGAAAASVLQVSIRLECFCVCASFTIHVLLPQYILRFHICISLLVVNSPPSCSSLLQFILTLQPASSSPRSFPPLFSVPHPVASGPYNVLMLYF